jgi:ABC-type transport system involved in multi-copper enzyme maturation permease subunit
MTAAPMIPVSVFERVRWLAGPLVDKELRVASRHRRHYLLRFAYVALLSLVTFQFWYTTVLIGGGASAVGQVSRFAGAGRGVIVTIVGFQFAAAQLLAAVLLSDAISSEIRQRTMESLLVTPLGAMRIVTGKLVGRLVPLVLLLGISLPVLAVARVFGGVPWDYVIAGLCITLSGAVFAGSLSLLYSITYRHAYQPVLVVGLWYLVVWGFLTFPVISLSAAGYFGYAQAVYVMSLLDPILALVTRTQALSGGAGARNAPAPLLLHCLTMLTASAALLALAVRRVRRVALAYQGGASRGPKADWRTTLALLRGQGPAGSVIRRVQGRPLVWKEQSTSLLRGRGRNLFAAALCVVGLGFLLVQGYAFGRPLSALLVFVLVALHGLFVISLAVAAAGAVTREKEARTWPILLTTPLEDHEIVKDKALAAFRKSVWLLSFLVLFYLVAALHVPPWDFFLLLLSVSVNLVGTIVFVLGLGLYLSTRLKTTAGAVLSTLALYFVPKLFCCGMPGPLLFLGGGGPTGPFQASAGGALFLVALVPALIYAALGRSCLRAATRRVRRDIF